MSDTKHQLTWIPRIIVIGFAIIAILLACAGACNGQSGIKKHVVPGVLVFLSGVAEGVMDHLQFHGDNGNQFWDPRVSWVNKYKNRDVSQGMTFRGKYLVFTTDGWHLMKFSRNITMFAAFTFKLGEPKKKWYLYVAEAAGYWAVNRVGFNITYNLLR